NFKLRSEVASTIKRLVAAVRLAPAGILPLLSEAELKEHEEQRQNDPEYDRMIELPSFRVFLRNGVSREAWPDPKDPYKYVGDDWIDDYSYEDWIEYRSPNSAGNQ